LKTNTTPYARLLAYVTGLVSQQLLLQIEYLAAENRILKARLQPGWRLSEQVAGSSPAGGSRTH
jgi:hypothetical protein